MRFFARRISYQPFTLTVLLVMCAAIVTPAAVLAAPPVRSESTPVLKTAKGKASYYGARFHGRKTASGRKFNMNTLVAAHPSWPFGTIVRVTTLKNKHSVNIEVIDRGPARSAQRKGVLIDLSAKTAQTLDFIEQGIADVRLDVLEWGRGRR